MDTLVDLHFGADDKFSIHAKVDGGCRFGFGRMWLVVGGEIVGNPHGASVSLLHAASCLLRVGSLSSEDLGCGGLEDVSDLAAVKTVYGVDMGEWASMEEIKAAYDKYQKFRLVGRVGETFDGWLVCLLRLKSMAARVVYVRPSYTARHVDLAWSDVIEPLSNFASWWRSYVARS